VSTELSGPDDVRVGHIEREAVVRRLNDAFGEGRLDLEELDQRISQAYAAKTLGQLRPLLVDLPVTPGRAAAVSRGTKANPARSGPAREVSGRVRAGLARRPAWIRWQYYVWTSVVALNVVIWALVSIGTGTEIYPWPLWVAGPWGIAILAQDVVARLEYGRRAR